MQKKGFIAVLSAVVLMIVASISLVLAVGHNASANSGIIADKWEDFIIDDDGVLYGFSSSFHPDIVIIPYGVREISHSAFREEVIREITIPGSVTIIGSSAFYRCDYLTSVNIMEGVKCIEPCVFECCYSLTSIILPISLTEISSYAFSDSGLTEIIVQNPDLLENENLQSYADIMRYEAPKYTVTFDTDGAGEIDNQRITKNEMVTKPTDPTKDGYEFKGWLLNGEPYDFATPVTADMTLTAQWEAIPEQPEPSNPAQPTTPENPEQPTTPDTDTETVTAGSKNGFNLGAAIGGGLVAGLGTISAITATVIVRRRHK